MALQILFFETNVDAVLPLSLAIRLLMDEQRDCALTGHTRAYAVHAAGNRLVALKDSSSVHGIDVYAIFPRRCSRPEARDCSHRLRAVFQMAYNAPA